MSAVRLARAATGRRAIVKFDGCYHGHADALLAAGGLGRRDARPARFARRHAGHRRRHAGRAVQRSRRGRGALRARGDEIAAVLVEPVAGNMGVVPPDAGFLQGSARSPARNGALLVFDEVMTGWRVHRARRAGALRRRARHHRPRQGDRRRASRRGVRRPRASSWSRSRPRARSIRRARSRAIRSRWPPGSRRSTCSAVPACGRRRSGGRRAGRRADRDRRPRRPVSR